MNTIKQAIKALQVKLNEMTVMSATSTLTKYQTTVEGFTVFIFHNEVTERLTVMVRITATQEFVLNEVCMGQYADDVKSVFAKLNSVLGIKEEVQEEIIEKKEVDAKHFLNKVQSLSALLGKMKYFELNGTKRYEMYVDEFTVKFAFNKAVGKYAVTIRTTLTEELRFKDIGKLDSVEEIDHTFGSLAEIILILQLV